MKNTNSHHDKKEANKWWLRVTHEKENNNDGKKMMWPLKEKKMVKALKKSYEEECK